METVRFYIAMPVGMVERERNEAAFREVTVAIRTQPGVERSSLHAALSGSMLR